MILSVGIDSDKKLKKKKGPNLKKIVDNIFVFQAIFVQNVVFSSMGRVDSER